LSFPQGIWFSRSHPTPRGLPQGSPWVFSVRHSHIRRHPERSEESLYWSLLLLFLFVIPEGNLRSCSQLANPQLETEQ
jgi:hypothetical protein